MASYPYLNPLESFEKLANENPKNVYLRRAQGDNWVEWTFEQSLSYVKKLASALKNAGLNKGDKVAIVSKNCPEWFLCDLAIWGAGGVSVPLYTTLEGEEMDPLLEHSEAKFLFIGRLDFWKKQVKTLKSEVPRICFDSSPQQSCQNISSFVNANNGVENFDLHFAEENDLASIIYTSGTTGTPKGVMHNFSTFSFGGQGVVDVMGVTTKDRAFSVR